MRGFIWAFAAVIAASVITVAIRGTAEYMDTRMIVLIRFWVTVLVGGLALMMFSGLRGQVRFSQPKRHILRGLFIALATHFGFYAIANVPLAAVSAIFFTAPIFAAILSIFIHGEKIGLRRASAIAVGFLGVLIFLRPDTQLPPLGVLSALGSSLFYASALIMSRGLADKDGVLSTVASASVITAIFSLILVQGAFCHADGLGNLGMVGFGDYRWRDAPVLRYPSLSFWRGCGDCPDFLSAVGFHWDCWVFFVCRSAKWGNDSGGGDYYAIHFVCGASRKYREKN